jgi:hypothetical protein
MHDHLDSRPTRQQLGRRTGAGNCTTEGVRPNQERLGAAAYRGWNRLSVSQVVMVYCVVAKSGQRVLDRGGPDTHRFQGLHNSKPTPMPPAVHACPSTMVHSAAKSAAKSSHATLHTEGSVLEAGRTWVVATTRPQGARSGSRHGRHGAAHLLLAVALAVAAAASLPCGFCASVGKGATAAPAAGPAGPTPAVPPIPDPPNVAARQAELRSYSASTCTEPVPTVTDAQLVFGTIGRGEAPYLEEWVRAVRSEVPGVAVWVAVW